MSNSDKFCANELFSYQQITDVLKAVVKAKNPGGYALATILVDGIVHKGNVKNILSYGVLLKMDTDPDKPQETWFFPYSKISGIRMVD